MKPNPRVTRDLGPEVRTRKQRTAECKRRVVLACLALGYSQRLIAAGTGLSPARVRAIALESTHPKISPTSSGAPA